MTAASFDSKAILDGIRRWVEIETPTEAPQQVNKLADLVADGYRDLPASLERIAGRKPAAWTVAAISFPRSGWRGTMIVRRSGKR